MKAARAKKLAPLYGWEFWYDRAQRTWCLTRQDAGDPEPARYIAPIPLAQLSESAFRERYLSVDGQDEPRVASREEQHARYIDCGPQAWDDRDSESGDY